MSDQKENGGVALAPVVAAPIVVAGGQLRPRNLSETVTLAKIMARSGMVPKDYAGRPDAIVVAMQMGAAVGLPPMQALRGIAVINGRPSLWGDALLAVVKSHPEFEDIEETQNEETMTATCVIKRRGETPTVQTFSQSDAARAGLWGKAGPWTQYPRRMLQMRARGFACRDAFADALCGLGLAEEAMDMAPVIEPINLSDFQEEDVIFVNAPPEPGETAPEEAAPAPEPEPEPVAAPQMPTGDRREFAKALKAAKLAEGAVALFGASDTWTTADAPGLRKLLARGGELVEEYGPPDGWGAFASAIRGAL